MVGDGAEVKQLDDLFNPLIAAARAEEVSHRACEGQAFAGHPKIRAHGDVVEKLEGLPCAGQALVGQLVRGAPEHLGSL